MQHRDDYYSIIRQTKKLGKLMPMLEFLAFCFCEAAQNVTKEAKALLKKKSLNPEERQTEILKLVKKKKEIRMRDIINLFLSVFLKGRIYSDTLDPTLK